MTFRSIAVLVMAIASVACNDLAGLAGKQSLPSGVSDPSTVNTPEGALEMYVGALYQFQYNVGSGAGYHTTGQNGAFVDFVIVSGLLTDELQAGDLGGVPNAYTTITGADSIDARIFPEESLYNELQAVRGAGNQALGALAAYDSTASPALRGQLFAYQGYAEILLADLFCSGVPLSTVDFNKDITYHAGSTTSEIYQHAITLFDSAIALSTDSLRVEYLAYIGKARTLLDLGQYAAAAQVVEDIPDDFAYQFMVDWSAGAAGGAGSIFGEAGHPIGSAVITKQQQGVTVADQEGVNGLPYISSGDPRTAVEKYNTNANKMAQYAPIKYGTPLPSARPVTVASGIEARLIEAEAALQRGDIESWLATLNTLRTDGSFTTAPSSDTDSVGVIDTTWNAGTGGVAGLRPLSDPGSDSARVTLLFTERAYWLFLTGERQGDLRRLVRNYNRDPEAVYPTGVYPLGGVLPRYGTDVSIQIPSDEFANPLYRGCLSRGA
jgi:hypothetical protein